MEIACIMCTWEEKEMAPLAMESSKDFVDRYVIVDRASEDGTIDAIQECRDRWNLDVDIYIEPDLALNEARMFALEKVQEDWVLIQDGDEICHTDGPNAIFNLKKYLRIKNTIFCTPMTILAGDLLHTRSNYRTPPHPFLYHNNSTFFLRNDRGQDLPGMAGVRIILSRVYKFNCFIKSPKRMFLRQYWKEWCQTTDAYKKYSSLEDYAKKKLGVKDLEPIIKDWYRKYLEDLLVSYDEEKHGYYPKVIREYVRRGKIRGYGNS